MGSRREVEADYGVADIDVDAQRGGKDFRTVEGVDDMERGMVQIMVPA